MCKRHGMGDLLFDDAGYYKAYSEVRIPGPDGWTEDTFGEGPQSSLSHVVVGREWWDVMPPASAQEESVLGELHEDRVAHSRLGCEVRLTKALDGLTVFVPDPPPHEHV